jgi:hypothetical protein
MGPGGPGEETASLVPGGDTVDGEALRSGDPP